MPRDGGATRKLIMDTAEALILDYGFSAASIDRLIERAGITKGAFFYHFKSKADLGHALVERYSEQDLRNLETNMQRAEKLSRDPLQQLLIFVGLFREHAAALTEPYPGCLFASYCSEQQLFEPRTLRVIETTMQAWRQRVGEKLRQTAEAQAPRLPVDLDGLADMLTVVFEGAFIVSKAMKDPQVVAEQLGHYRNYLELLFDAEMDLPSTG
jgi:TetR/AcrR family transcriptional repressor of nem operon